MRIFKSNFSLEFLPFSIFAVSQIKGTRNQNQSSGVNIFSRNFEEKNKSKTSSYQQFQITIWRNSGDIDQTKCFKNKVLNEVAAEPQKEQHCQFKWSWSEPSLACSRKRNETCYERKIEQHRDATFFRSDHFFDQNILQREKESSANRDAVKDVELKFIIGCPSRNNCQSDESDQGCDPSKFCYVFVEKNFRENKRKQRNRPENDNDFSQWQRDYGVNVEKKTYRTENSSDDIQEELIGFECRFSLRDHEGKQGDQTEKESEKSYFKSAKPLSHKLRNYVVSTANKHLAEKEHDSMPISVQNHKLSEIESGLFITFMVRNENIF
jgi:hypothetical protein